MKKNISELFVNNILKIRTIIFWKIFFLENKNIKHYKNVFPENNIK